MKEILGIAIAILSGLAMVAEAVERKKDDDDDNDDNDT